MLVWSAITLTLLALSCAEENVTKQAHKRSYVCPPDFVRLSNKCYYFSKTLETWERAYWKCNDMHSNLATIRSPYQDKILRRLLNKSTVASLERWIGGRYDWYQMNWQWAASGKKVEYQGFSTPKPTAKESMRWHCIILNPKTHYMWDDRSCLEEKHYICQTKIKNVSRKEKKKLARQYNATKYKKLNEVPVPDIPMLDNNIYVNSSEVAKLHYNYDNNELSNTAFAHRSRALRKRKGRKGKGRKKNRIMKEDLGVLQDAPIKEGAKNRVRKTGKTRRYRKPGERLNWKTYYGATISPLHPRAIVEEFSYT